MRLEEYLKAIKECPDDRVKYTVMGYPHTRHRLSAEFGISSNFSIHLKVDYMGLNKYMNKCGDYKLIESHKIQAGEEDEPQLFRTKSGAITIPIMPIVPWILPHADYTVAMSMHPFQKKKIDDISWVRAMANAIYDFGQFILEENIPASFPDSTGWRYIDLHDDSFIVVHEPVGPIKSEYLRIKEDKI
jgi:hypothetical protein